VRSNAGVQHFGAIALFSVADQALDQSGPLGDAVHSRAAETELGNRSRAAAKMMSCERSAPR
jgi:hypothetical protein